MDKAMDSAFVLFILLIVVAFVAFGVGWEAYQCGRAEAENELLKAQIQTMTETNKQEENQ